MENQKSAIGLDGNIASALGYPIGLIAIILLFMEKENRFVRFHAFQSVLWIVAYIASIIVLVVFGVIIAIVGQASSGLATILGLLLTLLWLGLFLAWLGGMIFAAVKAYGGTEFKLPIVGNFAAKFAS
jgi:uncharacterized membrane protein